MVSWKKQLVIGFIYMMIGLSMAFIAIGFVNGEYSIIPLILSIVGLSLNIVGIYMIFRAMFTYAVSKKLYKK